MRYISVPIENAYMPYKEIGTGSDTKKKISILRNIFHKYGIDETELDFTLLSHST